MAAKPLKLFYCYAREDKIFRDKLDIHLSLLKRRKQVTTWSDREIGPGKEWEKEIDIHLNTAQLILLFISPDFLASDYSYGVEMKRALERHHEGTARVIPIILRPVYWEDAPFSHLQVLPADAKPITLWPDSDVAFREITLGISEAIRELRPLLKTKKEWLDEGWTLYRLERYDEALAAFDQSIRLKSNSTDSWNGKGWALYRLERYGEALAAFDQSIRFDPKSADSWDGKSWSFYRLRRYDEALVAFEQILHLNPDLHNTWDAWDGRGWTFYRLERYDEALAAFEQALHFDPDSPDSWDGKANTFRKLKRIQEARHAFEKVHQLRNR